MERSPTKIPSGAKALVDLDQAAAGLKPRPFKTGTTVEARTKAETEPRAYLSRRYRVSASHRLAREEYSEAENRAVYGKCANPHGHGHNYVIEVTVGGPVDAVTGMVCDLGELDGFARTNVVERFDHMNLNTLAEFREVVSTTENFTIEVWRIFERFRGAKVVRVRIEETGKNSFEYGG